MRDRFFLLLVICGVGSCAPSTAPSAAPKAVVRWSLPTCPLRYELFTTERFEADGGPSELITFTTVDAVRDGPHLELRATPTVAIKKGKHRPYALPDTGFAPLMLVTDGRRWRMVGDSPLYARFGTQGGLSWLFPELPTASSPAWDFPIGEIMLNYNGVAAMNSRATTFGEGSEPRLFPLHADGATSPEGRLDLRARGPERWSSRSADGGANDFAILDRKGEIRARHVILPNGRLLLAHLERDVELTFTVTGGEPMRSRYIQRSDAHLVAACDGPTEATLAPVLSREERAIAAVGDLGLALGAEDRREAAVATWFSPGLRKAHGDPAIVATIERYRKGAGAQWWPLPVFIEDDDVMARSDRIEVAVTTNVPSPTSAQSVTGVKFRFEMLELEGRFLVDRVTAAFEIEPGNAELLEIARARLFP